MHFLIWICAEQQIITAEFNWMILFAAPDMRVHPHTCLRRFDCMTLWCLIQGNKPTLWGVFKALSSKVELQLCILVNILRNNLCGIHLAHVDFLTTFILNCFLVLPWAHRRQRKPDSSDFEGCQKPNRGHYLEQETREKHRTLLFTQPHMSYTMKIRSTETAPFLE